MGVGVVNAFLRISAIPKVKESERAKNNKKTPHLVVLILPSLGFCLLLPNNFYKSGFLKIYM